MKQFTINQKTISDTSPCYIIAEISCNHEGDIEEAKAIIRAAAEAGVDAAKLQTYTADTITRNFDTKPEGTMWAETDLHSLYQKAETPWEWYGELQAVADECGLALFSSPFDETAVDFLVEQNVPVLKVASFEIVDTKLLAKMAQSGIPIIMSTGMTDFLEIKEALDVLKENGAKDIAVLHCNSGYPAAFDECNLKTINALRGMFDHVIGLSDHTIFADDKNYIDPVAHVAPLEAVKLGAKIIEVHLTMDRNKGRAMHAKNTGGFDWAFSRNPDELKKMVDVIRAYERGEVYEYTTDAEKKAAALSHGEVSFTPTQKEIASRKVRPSLWVVENIKAGEPLIFAGGMAGNIDSIRPGGGLHIRFADYIDGCVAARDITAGMPVTWDMIKTQTK